MIEVEGPVYYFTYHSRDGPKKREIKIKPKELSPRGRALEILPRLIKMTQRKDKKARDFAIQEVFVFKNGS